MSIVRAVKNLSLIRAMLKSNYQHASDLMGEMHGLPQKLGQHFTLYMAAGFDQYFQTLCNTSKAENLPVTEILDELNISYHSFKLCAQASIGQVYRVEAHDGTLAVKVKYPGVEQRIKSDFGMLKGLLWPLRLLPLKNSSLMPLLQQMKELLIYECDYAREALDQKSFCRLFAGDPDILVPEVISYSDRAIASRWVDGSGPANGLDGIAPWFVETYLRFIVKSLKGLGIVHSDPHPGNFIITGGNIAADTNAAIDAKKKLAVLDFGSVVRFTPEEVAAVGRLLSGSYHSEAELVIDLERLGMSRESLEMYRPIIGDLVSVLMEPLYYPGVYNFADWRIQYKLNTLLASRSWEKPLHLPPKLLLLVRTIQGVYFYARRNFVQLNWHATVRKCWE